MTAENLTDIYTFFSEGVMYGIAISFVPFILGYGIQSIYSIIKNS